MKLNKEQQKILDMITPIFVEIYDERYKDALKYDYSGAVSRFVQTRRIAEKLKMSVRETKNILNELPPHVIQKWPGLHGVTVWALDNVPGWLNRDNGLFALKIDPEKQKAFVKSYTGQSNLHGLQLHLSGLKGGSVGT